jgi:hypothetical protein
MLSSRGLEMQTAVRLTSTSLYDEPCPPWSLRTTEFDG